ncbi:MAG TPA: hypothetical protein VLE54_05210 [Thermoanaerobaculia bacterium]|nr:hypothetical protein [Thermoanaerobaculia bacterium]
MRAGAGGAILLITAAIGCSDYQQTLSATKSIWSVRAVTDRREVADCRLIGRVDSNDSVRGCGLTVQPTVEECLRYQVVSVDGDTLLMNGFVGEAYDCAGRSVPPATTLAETPGPTPAPAASPSPRVPTSPPRERVRFVARRDDVKGCVYLDEVNAKASCPNGSGESKDCLAELAIQSGGNTVLLAGDGAQVFACKSP